MDDKIYFETGEGPEVEIVDLCKIYGCKNCPGLTTAGRAGIQGLDPDQWVTCNHQCHQAVQ